MGDWNHNIHYQRIALAAVPSNCKRALDVGCGEGALARQLVRYCEEVVAIDADHQTLMRGKSAADPNSRLIFVEGDVMIPPFRDKSFDVITAVATLHHLPLRPALLRFRSLLQSGGILAVIGLYRAQTLQDYALSACAIPASWMLRCLHHQMDVGAPQKEPAETLREIRSGFDTVLPGGVFRRRLLFRYSFVWRKP